MNDHLNLIFDYFNGKVTSDIVIRILTKETLLSTIDVKVILGCVSIETALFVYMQRIGYLSTKRIWV